MTFISYAQNNEDVMLWRALKHVGAGFYIDIGAAHPDEYSVTRAFYDRGWRGINVEPTSAYFQRLAGSRPRDLNLNIALAARAGQLQFFEVEGTGLSTLDRHIAAEYRAAGRTVHEFTLQASTLAELCREWVTSDVHFLKIDVEGAEAAVLTGADLSLCRPWLIVVEATRPLSSEQNYFEWEELVTASDYRFAYFDGLNRFYVAVERWDELSPAFALPPNVFDDFIRAADSEHLNRIIAAEQRAAHAQAIASQAQTRAMQADAMSAEIEVRRAATEECAIKAEERARQAEIRATQADAIAAQIDARRAATEERASQAEIRATEAEAVAAHTTAAHIAALAQIAALRTSTSWRATRPLRGLGYLLRGHAGAVLLGAGVPLARVERLARVAGNDGGAPKRAGRILFYVAGRAAVRTFPAAAAAPLQRLAPSPWFWLNSRYQAYLARSATHPIEAVPPSINIPTAPPASPSSTIVQHPRAHPARQTRTIHQFHSGSSTGDAITNSMFLIQRWLRKAGYESNIFVEHRHPQLTDRLFEISDLPLHGDYVLIVHHSMGYDACERIIALPARKILMYHNITPPEFLCDFPGAIPYAELGRRQLSMLRPHMSAALADSEFNALELRSHGYDAPVACPFLFDVQQLITEHRAGEARCSNAPFIVLFVGRVVASKGQADLVDAFAEFRSLWDGPSQLVLVGSTTTVDAAYPAEVQRRIDLHDLRDAVLVTGAISDAELHGWYRVADLYVSLSHHEGFGVPLVEAMAHDVPVIAWPAGAVPYTLGDAGELLPNRAPADVAAAMLRLAKDTDLRAGIVARQRAALDRFKLDHQAPKLVKALLMAGAAPLPDEVAQRAFARNLSIAVTGHINGTYSLAAVNRTLALALDQRRPGSARIVAWESGPTSDLSGVPLAHAPQIEDLASRPQPPTGPEVVISQHYPVHVPLYRGDAAFAMVFWEESLLPEVTVGELSRGFAGVFAPTTSVARALIDSGVSVPVFTVGYTPHLEAFYCLAQERRASGRDADRAFTFLHVSSCFPRKGVDALLAAFQQAFRSTDAVRLIIKGFPNPHNDVPEQVARLRESDPDLGEIIVINEEFDGPAMLGLYRQADAAVLPTRGEGFNIPAAEAMAAGIPLIVTGYGGHLDFCSPEDARLIDFRFAPSQSHLATPGSVWIEPDQADLANALRQAVVDFAVGGGVSAAKSVRALHAIRQRLDPLAWADCLNSAAIDQLTAPPPSPLRVAVVSTWGVRCGIAEYSRFLLERLTEPDRDDMDPPVILADDRTLPSHDGAMRVRPSWSLLEPESVERLARTVATEDPQALLIQHQPGLLRWSDLAKLLTDRRVHDRITVVTLHAAPRLLSLTDKERAEVISSLGQASRVLVHQIADLNLLKDLGLTANVTLFPQGAPPRFAAPSSRLLTPRDTPIIGSYGFFLPGKGLPRLIQAAAQLRRKWPQLRLTLVNAEYPTTTSQEEVTRCRDLARSLELDDAIEWDTAFHPHEESMCRLARCDLLVLPYDESSESSSAALRSAMASGIPVAVAPIALFRDAGAAVHRFDNTEVKAIAAGVDLLLRDRDARVGYQQSAATWLQEHSWDVLARRLKGMLLGLQATAPGLKRSKSELTEGASRP